MTPNDTLQHYLALKNRWNGSDIKLHELEQAGLRLAAPKALTDPELVWQEVQSFAPQQGWLAFQSEVRWFFHPSTLGRQGILLYGEVSRDESSLHIRQDGRGGWLLYPISWIPAGSGYLLEECSFLSINRAIGKLQYQIFWQQDAEHGFVRRYSRFCGMTRREEEGRP